MMEDIRRICLDPTAEDRSWFPDIAGNDDPYATLREAWANFRDESFILQYLSPNLIRRFRLFEVTDDSSQSSMSVDAIHDELGYRRVRSALSKQYDLARREPDIQVVDVDLAGDRCLVLSHTVYNGILLEEKTCQSVLRHIAGLWGYNVRLVETDALLGETLKSHEIEPPPI